MLCMSPRTADPARTPGIDTQQTRPPEIVVNRHKTHCVRPCPPGTRETVRIPFIPEPLARTHGNRIPIRNAVPRFVIRCHKRHRPDPVFTRDVFQTIGKTVPAPAPIPRAPPGILAQINGAELVPAQCPVFVDGPGCPGADRPVTGAFKRIRQNPYRVPLFGEYCKTQSF